MNQLATRPTGAHAATYRFMLEITRADGTVLPRVPIEPDWEPAFESTAFDATRSGALPPVSLNGGGSVEPIWHAKRGAPYVSGFRAHVEVEGERASADIPTAYVRPLARQASTRFVDSGQLDSGEVFTFRVCAFPAQAGGPAQPAGFAMESVAEPLPLVAGCLSEIAAGADARGTPAAGDMPLLVAPRVLEDALAMSTKAGDVEVGGVLVGLLRRDAGAGEIFLEVTALIPAQHTIAQATKMTFTAETWAAADAAIALRRRNEIKCGWFHFHPNFCRKCPQERRAVCAFREPFFSEEDRHLHRVCFSRAHHVALLITETSGAGFVTTAYGWRNGMVEERAYSALP